MNNVNPLNAIKMHLCYLANLLTFFTNFVKQCRYRQVLAFQKAGGRLALSLYVFLPTACFHFELLELVHVDLF